MAILFRSFGVIAHKHFKMIWLYNSSILSVLDEGYPRNASCALNFILIFLFQIRLHKYQMMMKIHFINVLLTYHKWILNQYIQWNMLLCTTKPCISVWSDRLTRTLLNQGFLVAKAAVDTSKYLRSASWLGSGISMSRMTTEMFRLS